ncbi:sulfotransferase family protein [Gaopeijia maritima]|uniref:Sulfotransferase n=1 Tax=Gaopeijia maritima TaxID=3119007 RepID=A0ABU9E7M6_9BACT
MTPPLTILSQSDADELARTEPVVVMSRGHSGTRVLSWALAALGIHMGTLRSEPAGDCQDRRFTGAIKKVADSRIGTCSTRAPGARETRRFRRALWRYLRGVPRDGRRWGWKFPETYLIGGVVDTVVPRARYLHLVRDGRDVAFKSHLTDDEGRRLGRTILGHLGLLGRPRHLQAAGSWAYQVQRFRALRPVLEPRVHRLTFEQLCTRPVETMEAVAGFLGLPMTDECRRYLAEQVRPEKVGQHRGEDPAKLRAVEALIGETLAAEGYPPAAR